VRSSDLERLVRGEWRDAVEAAFRARGEAMPDGAPEIGYVRFKPDVGCLLGVQVRTGAASRAGGAGTAGSAKPGGDSPAATPLGYLKVFTAGAAAEECAAKYRPREPTGGWVELLPGGRAVFFRFPLDRNVRGLRFVTDVDRLKHLLHAGSADFSPDGVRIRGGRSHVRLLKYKPERRCIVRAHLALRDGRTGGTGARDAVAQANGDDTGAEVARVLGHLQGRSDAGALRSPRPLGYDTANRVLVLEWMEGEELGAMLAEPRAADACAAAGRALRELHGASLPPGPPVRSAEPVRERVSRILFDLARTGGGCLASRAKDLGTRFPPALDDAGAVAPRLLHGDFYFHQVIVGPDGCGVIDWDETATGDPRTDVGNFLAHLHLRELQGVLAAEAAGRLRDAFLDGYRGDATGPEAALDTFTAAQLALLCLSPFRSLSPDWRAECAAILERTHALLAAGAKVPR
jgi:hypothetical protein